MWPEPCDGEWMKLWEVGCLSGSVHPFGPRGHRSPRGAPSVYMVCTTTPRCSYHWPHDERSCACTHSAASVGHAWATRCGWHAATVIRPHLEQKLFDVLRNHSIRPVLLSPTLGRHHQDAKVGPIRCRLRDKAAVPAISSRNQRSIEACAGVRRPVSERRVCKRAVRNLGNKGDWGVR